MEIANRAVGNSQKTLKSTRKALKGRGMVTKEETEALASLSMPKLLEKLHDADAALRTSAAICLHLYADEAAEELLLQLSKEKCLYTRLAICESLAQGTIETAGKMTVYLGRIGTNQHKILPDKVSAKKSFPLPRDIIARSLGKMDSAVFPALTEILESGSTEQVGEALDAVGYMVFYNPALATEENCKRITSLQQRYAANPLILWKILLCLSAFPCKESVAVLTEFAKAESILGLEAQRSLRILSGRGGRSEEYTAK